jgi:hypothetical protein
VKSETVAAPRKRINHEADEHENARRPLLHARDHFRTALKGIEHDR